MKPRWRSLQPLAVWIAAVGPVSSDAHVGDVVFPIYEVSQPNTPDLFDGTVEDWKSAGSVPSITSADLISLTGPGSLSRDDLAVSIHLGWSRDDGRIYFAIERLDDSYINEYDGTTETMWRHDNVEIMIDGDHSGGAYDGLSHDDYNADERKRLENAQAQMYVAIAESPDDQLIYNLGAADGWVSRPPWAEVSGYQEGDGPNYSLIEGAVTPWDDLAWTGPQDSQQSVLEASRIIGIQISIPDFDQEPGVFQGYHALWGEATTWREADNFVDGVLLCATCDLSSAVVEDSWARIKASLRRRGRWGD